MAKLLFICKNRTSYGQTYGLQNSAQFVSNSLKLYGIDSECVLAIDGNDVDRLVTQYDPTHVIIEALWVTPAKLTELLSIQRHSKRKWIVRLHSCIPFLANEGVAFDWLSKYDRRIVIAPNVEELTKDLRDLNICNTDYLPNIYEPTHDGTMTLSAAKKHKDPEPEELEVDFRKPHKDDGNGVEIKIGCFGAIRPMKNHLTQAIAAIRFANIHRRPLEFHINGTRSEQRGDQVLKNLEDLFTSQPNHKLIEHPWLKHEDFLELVKTMDMGLQVSFTESFNIVSADFVFNRIPLIGSAAIPWLPTILCADPNSTDSIVRTMQMAWYGKWVGLCRLARLALDKSNQTAIETWLSFLEN